MWVLNFSASVPGSMRWQMEGLGKLNCAELNRESISGQSECETAAKKLGIDFNGDTYTEARPKGCIKVDTDDGNTVWEYMYWNAHPEGAARSDSVPICKVTGNHNL